MRYILYVYITKRNHVNCNNFIITVISTIIIIWHFLDYHILHINTVDLTAILFILQNCRILFVKYSGFKWHSLTNLNTKFFWNSSSHAKFPLNFFVRRKFTFRTSKKLCLCQPLHFDLSSSPRSLLISIPSLLSSSSGFIYFQTLSTSHLVHSKSFQTYISLISKHPLSTFWNNQRVIENHCCFQDPLPEVHSHILKSKLVVPFVVLYWFNVSLIDKSLI